MFGYSKPKVLSSLVWHFSILGDDKEVWLESLEF